MKPPHDELSWLSDVNLAAQHLTRLTLETSAQAALINRNLELWAYAGQLPQDAASELAEMVTRFWDKKVESDLVRFIHLSSTGAEHMLYATRLDAGLVLALLFDAETPFSTIRSQANHLARSLSVPNDGDEIIKSDDYETPEITSLLADVPPPNPPKEILTPQPDFYNTQTSRESELAEPFPISRSLGSNSEQSPVIHLRSLVYTEEATSPTQEAELETSVDSTAITRETPKESRQFVPDLAEETLPSSVTEVARRIVLEPVSPSVYNLTYACLLIPRFTQHYLTGNLADQLSEWIPEICVAFGWRLERLSVRPEYLQWIVNVPPTSSPGTLMRLMRQHTSERIFADFPRFKKENPSGDFWAPGYLIMGGTQPPPAQLIKDFIKQSRERQGVY